MRRICIAGLVVLAVLTGARASVIVTNSSVSPTAEDSVAFVFYNLDSLGQNVGGLDTTRVVVRNSSGVILFSEKVAGIAGRVSEVVADDDTSYVYRAAVADIDGSGYAGCYAVSVVAKSDASGGWLRTPHRFEFQLVDWKLDQMGSAAIASLDSLQSHDDWVARVSNQSNMLSNQVSLSADMTGIQTGLATVEDSTNETLSMIRGRPEVDVAEISGDAAAANDLEALLDGTGGVDVRLKSLHVVTPDAGDTAVLFSATNLAGGTGFYTRGTDYGFYARGTDSFDSHGVGAKFEGVAYDVVGDVHGLIDSVKNNVDSVCLTNEDKSELAGITADSVLSDSLAYRGGSAGLDSAAIARSVWNTPQVNHVLAGTFGSYLDSDISGLGSGSGAYSFDVVAFDTLAGQVIPGAGVAVRNLEQTSLIASGRTGTDGHTAFNLDADSYVIVASASGYLFSSFDTIAVAGAGQDTVYGVQFDPGQPVSASLCRVFGFLYDVSGNPHANVTVMASLPDEIKQHANVLISPLSVTTVTDTLGYFWLDLIPSDELQPEGERYEFTISDSDGVILRKRLSVPDNSSWQISW